MPKGQQLLDGALTGYPPPTLSLMKEGFAKSWPIVSARFQGIEAIAEARMRLAKAIVAVTSLNATDADDIARMAIDQLSLKDAPNVLSEHQSAKLT